MNNEITITNEQHQEVAILQDQMNVNGLLEQVKLIKNIMQNPELMKKDVHYGVIPGCGDKPSLFKAGAEKLAFTFRLSVLYDITQTNLENGHREYKVVATVKHINSDKVFGQGVGCCSTFESKFRYRTENTGKPVPQQYWTSGKDVTLLGGTSYSARKIKGSWIIMHKVEHDNPADYYNTILKMAKKRAYVDGIISATSISDTFSQDVEEIKENDDQDNFVDESTSSVKQENKNDAPNGLISDKQIGFARNLMKNYSNEELKIIKEEMLQGDKTLPKALEEYSNHQAKVLIDKLKFTKESKKIIDKSNNYLESNFENGGL